MRVFVGRRISGRKCCGGKEPKYNTMHRETNISFNPMGLGVVGNILKNNTPFTVDVLGAKWTSVLDIAGTNGYPSSPTQLPFSKVLPW